MSVKKPSFNSFALGALALLAVPFATFGQVEQLGPYMSTSTTSSGSFTFSDVPTFNTSLGTLTGVYLSLTLDSKALVVVSNYNSVSENFTNASASFSPATVTLSLSGNSLLSVTAPSTTTTLPSGTVGANSTFVGQNGPTSSDTRNTIELTNLSAFEGDGTSTVPINLSFLEGLGSYTGTSAGGVLFGGEDKLEACLSIDYFYTCNCVPEPSSLGLIAFSLGGLFFFRRFRFGRA
jgi:hypothetical protein